MKSSCFYSIGYKYSPIASAPSYLIGFLIISGSKYSDSGFWIVGYIGLD
jgi:hypothetical protein